MRGGAAVMRGAAAVLVLLVAACAGPTEEERVRERVDVLILAYVEFNFARVWDLLAEETRALVAHEARRESPDAVGLSAFYTSWWEKQDCTPESVEEFFRGVSVRDLRVQGDRARVELLLDGDVLAILDLVLENGEWKFLPQEALRDPFLWKHPDMDLPTALWSVKLGGEDLVLVLELHRNGRITCGEASVLPEDLASRIRELREGDRVSVRADRRLPWSDVAAITRQLGEHAWRVVAYVTKNLDPYAYVPPPTPYLFSTYRSRGERRLSLLLPVESYRPDVTHVVEICGAVEDDDFASLRREAEELSPEAVLIDAGPDVRWESVVRAIDALFSADIFDIYLAAPADDGAPEPGVRLIEDPAGHPALSRIIRAKTD